MTTHIALSPAMVAGLCSTCKQALIAELGLTVEAVDPQPSAPNEDDSWEYAELGLQSARRFLQNCNPKTKMALAFIVKAGARFSLRTLEHQMGVGAGELRGVWTGLTKRTRTVTNDLDATLIRWSDQTEDGDFVGELMPVTRDSFQRALTELDE